MPEVSRSSRCTSSRNGASGRAWRSCSITPKLTPLPPCTATPAGLSMAIRCSSSQRMGNSRAGAGCSAFWATVSEMRSGGRRTMSPACTRGSACARPLLMRTWPPRRVRETWGLGDGEGGEAHHVACLHAGVGMCPALVDAHLAAADDAVDMGLGHALELAQQKIVEPLACAGAVDLHQAGRHRTCGDTAVGGRFGPYNAFHLRVCYVSG